MERLDQTVSDLELALLREHLGRMKWNESEIGCLVVGLGGLQRRDYQILKGDGLDVLWHGYDGPWFLFPIYLFAAAEFGAVRARNSDELLKIFDCLSQQTACEVIFFDAGFWSSIINQLESHGLRDYDTFKSGFLKSHGVVSVWVYTDQPADLNVVWCETYAQSALAESIFQLVQSLGQSVPSDHAK